MIIKLLMGFVFYPVVHFYSSSFFNFSGNTFNSFKKNQLKI